MQYPTIPQFARSRGVPRATMFRRLMAMHALDRQAGGADWVPWLFRYEGGPWRVNESRLRRAHPEQFDVPSNEELDRRVSRLEGQMEAVDAGHRALVGRVRKVEARIA